MAALKVLYPPHIHEYSFTTDLHQEGEGVHTLSSPVGRDALEESPSRPESEEVFPTHFPGNHDQTNQFAPPHETPPKVVTFDPNVGLSSGGLLETRIGAVGTSRDLNQQQKDGLHADVSAQMY